MSFSVCGAFTVSEASDIWGRWILSRQGCSYCSAAAPTEQVVRSAVGKLTGEISQVPPAYSAKSVDGTRAYDAARRGQPLDLPAAEVTVHSWEIRELKGDTLTAVITCSGGTYIRALARDLGRLVSSAAHLTSLRRTRVGEFDVRNAATLDALS